MNGTLVEALTSLGREAARIVLPASCIACDQHLPWRERTASCCSGCWSSLPRITTRKCTSCALPWGGTEEEFRCLACQMDPLPVAWSDAWGHYRGGLERVLHAFKFARHDFLDDALAGLLAETLTACGDAVFDAVVPVPMHRSKLRRRGYNQAELLARALGRRLHIACEPSLLTKRVERQAQSSLAREERAANVRGAFAADAHARGRAILIIDDVCTTGETLRACAKALAAQKPARVCTLVVAKA